jgi:hypothetical protein
MKAMLRRIVLGLMLAALALSAAADSVVGKWTLVATHATGERNEWTMTVKETDGKLSGNLSNANGVEVPMVAPTQTGDSFIFKLDLGGSVYTAEGKLDGKTLTGKYAGPEMSGTYKATRQ